MNISFDRADSFGMLAVAAGVTFGGRLLREGGKTLLECGSKTQSILLRTLGDWMVYPHQLKS